MFYSALAIRVKLVQGQVKRKNRHFCLTDYRDGTKNSCELKLRQQASYGMKKAAHKYGCCTK